LSQDVYTFGSRIAKRFDYFAFPRTGSHYLWACFTGLFDLVFYENEYTHMPEPVQRLKELNPLSSYSLKLREDGVPYQPVFINASANGTHGNPVSHGNPTIILIRDPMPVLYSYYKTAKDRWGLEDEPVAWAQRKINEYRAFYSDALKVIDDANQNTLLLRYEDLKNSDNELERVVEFVGIEPKLNCDFVRYWTEFNRMTIDGHRTFYRSGDNEAWKNDGEWNRILDTAEPGDFSEFGYK